MNPNDKKEMLLMLCDRIAEEINKSPDILSDHVYQMIDSFCCIYLTWIDSGGKDGWSQSISFLQDPQGKILEGGFRKVEGFFSYHQLGGSWIQKGGGSVSEPAIDDSTFPLFDSYEDYLHEVDQIMTQWNEIENALGIVKAEGNEEDVFIRKFFSLFTQSLALWISKNPMDDTSYTFFLHVCQLLWEILRGRFQQANQQFLAILQSPTAELELLSSFFIRLLLTVSPEIEEDLDYQFDKNSKTVFAGSLLWIFHHFAPSPIQLTVRRLFDQIYIFAGKERTPSTLLPNFQDIELFRDLNKQSDVICKYELQNIIKPLHALCILRLAFEFMNAPFSPSSCRTNMTRKLMNGGKKRKTRRVNT